ncbi:MAG: DUF3261 domain-containing protein [Sedimenticola sp.]
MVKPSLPKSLQLLPPSQGPGAWLLKQKVTMEARGELHRFLIVTRLESEQIRSVMLLPEGQPLISLVYDGENLIHKNRTDIEIPIQGILAIMQFSLWPEFSIREHYPTGDGWILSLSPQRRTLGTSDRLFLEVNFRAGGLVVDNHLHNYKIIIETLEKQIL